MSLAKYDQTRVNEAAAFIAEELKALLDRRHYDSHMSRRLRAACPAYNRGLTNGEREVATIRALNMAALEVLGDLASLKIEPAFNDFN